MRTLEGLPLNFPSLGWLAADWITEYGVYGPGSVAGQRVQLAEEDVIFLVWLYRLDPETGKRLASDADLSAPKGWAKSQLAGLVGLFEAFGPCRFAGWDANGDPVGRPITAPFINCLATEERQSGMTYRNVLYVLEHGDALANEYEYDPGKWQTFLPNGGVIARSTSGSASKDGNLETCTIADETHLYVLPELRDMYDTVDRNGRKRKLDEPLILRTSTMFAPGEESIAERCWNEFELFGLDAERMLLEAGVLVDHREAPDNFDLRDDDALRAALVALYREKAHFVDIDGIIRKDFRRAGANVANAQRYFLNRRVLAGGRWMSAQRWDRIADPKKRLKPGDRIALGFDGSRKFDATGFVACRLSDGLLVPLGYWQRPPRLPRHVDWDLPAGEVHQALEEINETYDVVAFFADPHWWHQEVDTWHGKWPDIVTKFDTGKTTRMVHAVERLNVDVDTGAVCHTGDRLLRRHVLNANAERQRVKLDPIRHGVTLAKNRNSRRNLIDLAMCAVLANEAKGFAIANGALEEEAVDKTLILS